MKPLILITCSSDDGQGAAGGGRYILYKNYAKRIETAGGLPVIAAGKEAQAYAAVARGLLLSGGGDLDPVYYGEAVLPDGNVAIDRERDEMELALFHAFLRAKKPVLGICRGLQLINVAMGGSLWQDLELQGHCRHSGTWHDVSITPGSALRRMFGSGLHVNSFHHQAIKAPAKGLKVTAQAGDVIEGVEHESLAVLAVQWHPERMEGMEPLFDWLVGAASGDGKF